MYDINQFVIMEAAVKCFGKGVQVTHPLWINTQEEHVTVNVTPYRGRSIRGRFYYKKQSFNSSDPDLPYKE
ncbi:hypothetical protein CCP1ISM_160012 [Azospirillaceae bacterium]